MSCEKAMFPTKIRITSPIWCILLLDFDLDGSVIVKDLEKRSKIRVEKYINFNYCTFMVGNSVQMKLTNDKIINVITEESNIHMLEIVERVLDFDNNHSENDIINDKDFNILQLVLDISGEREKLEDLKDKIKEEEEKENELKNRIFPKKKYLKSFTKKNLSKLKEKILTLKESVDDCLERRKNCIICWENEKNCVFLPCGHLNCCEIDAKQLFQNSSKPRCPTCRKVINSYEIVKV